MECPSEPFRASGLAWNAVRQKYYLKKATFEKRAQKATCEVEPASQEIPIPIFLIAD